MGLLAVLDYHKICESRKETKESVEIEYRLQSWGEIWPPFLLGYEHQIKAWQILRDFPLKLRIMTLPDVLPQQLCLTFIDPSQVEKDFKKVKILGVSPDEIAKEFAAFLSLVTRRRIFAIGQMRYNNIPLEYPAELYQGSHIQERQKSKEISPEEIYHLLENLQNMSRYAAKGFILATRLYHSAIKLMYSEPEFSYLFLVMCLETVSSIVKKDYKINEEELEELLNSKYPKWKELNDYQSNRDTLISIILANEKFIFNKLFKFVSENIPEKFWIEKEDDAKPDYLIRLMTKIGIAHSDIEINDLERIEKSNLKKVLRNVYSARSKLLHEGKNFPYSIVIGHFRKIPIDALPELRKNITLEIPPLLTFERLASYCMVEFLKKQNKR